MNMMKKSTVFFLIAVCMAVTCYMIGSLYGESRSSEGSVEKIEIPLPVQNCTEVIEENADVVLQAILIEGEDERSSRSVEIISLDVVSDAHIPQDRSFVGEVSCWMRNGESGKQLEYSVNGELFCLETKDVILKECCYDMDSQNYTVVFKTKSMDENLAPISYIFCHDFFSLATSK